MFCLRIAASSSVSLFSLHCLIFHSQTCLSCEQSSLAGEGALFRVMIGSQTPQELPEVPNILDVLEAEQNKDAQRVVMDGDPGVSKQDGAPGSASARDNSKESQLRGQERGHALA